MWIRSQDRKTLIDTCLAEVKDDSYSPEFDLFRGTDKIKEWLAIAERATPGPWELSGLEVYADESILPLPVCELHGRKNINQAIVDGSFIILSRTAFPDLCRAYLAQTAELERLRRIEQAAREVVDNRCYDNVHDCQILPHNCIARLCKAVYNKQALEGGGE